MCGANGGRGLHAQCVGVRASVQHNRIHKKHLGGGPPVHRCLWRWGGGERERRGEKRISIKMKNKKASTSSTGEEAGKLAKPWTDLTRIDPRRVYLVRGLSANACGCHGLSQACPDRILRESPPTSVYFLFSQSFVDVYALLLLQ